MSKAEWATIAATIAAGTREQITRATAEIWYAVLRDLPAQAVQAAALRYLAECQYPGLPTVGRLRALAVEAIHGRPLSPESAWASVTEAIHRHGYPNPASAREALGPQCWAVIQGIGGWGRICESHSGDRAALFAQFRDGWLRSSESDQRDRHLPPALRPPRRNLAGSIDAEPSATSPHLPAVAFQGPGTGKTTSSTPEAVQSDL